MDARMLAELQGILRVFNRDNIPANHFDRPMGTGTRVSFTYRQANRIYQLVKEIEESQRVVK